MCELGSSMALKRIQMFVAHDLYYWSIVYANNRYAVLLYYPIKHTVLGLYPVFLLLILHPNLLS